MRKIVLEYTEGTSVDADYYGMVDIHAPILLISGTETLSDEDLINEYAKTLNIDYVFETLDELKEMYKNNPSKHLKMLKEELKETNVKLNKVNKSTKELKDLGLDTSQFNDAIKNLSIEASECKNKIKELEKVEDKFEEILHKKEAILIGDYYNSDFYGLAGTTDVESFIDSEGELNLQNLVLNKHQLNFIRFLIDRGWEYVDLSKPLNQVSDSNCVKVEEMYELFNKELNIK